MTFQLYLFNLDPPFSITVPVYAGGVDDRDYPRTEGEDISDCGQNAARFRENPCHNFHGQLRSVNVQKTTSLTS
jgi:hypothetical protein